MAMVKDLLRKLQLGNSVAEFDNNLEKYFVETEPFRKLINDEIDVVAGDKGTGKTAIFRILQKRYATLDQFSNIEILPALTQPATRSSNIWWKNRRSARLNISNFGKLISCL